MKKVFIIIILLNAYFHLHSQNYVKINDYKYRIDTTSTDSIVGYLNFMLWKEYVLFNSDSAKYYINKTINLSSSNKQLAKIYTYKADNLYKIGLLNKSLENYNIALEIYIKDEDPISIARTYRNIGQLYYNLAQYSDAIQNYMQALVIYEKQKDFKGLLFLKKYMSDIYIITEEYEKVLILRDEIYEFVRENTDEYSEFDLAMVLNFLGDAYMLNSESAIAKECFNESILLGEKPIIKQVASYPQDVLLADNYQSLSEIEGLNRNYPEAIRLSQKAIAGYTRVGFNQKVGYSMLSIGEYYFKSNKNYECESITLKAYEISIEIEDIELLKYTTEQLATLYKRKGNFKEAYKFKELYHEYSDSLNTIKSIDDIQKTEMQFQFEIEKQKQESEQLHQNIKQQNEINKQKMIRNSILIALLLIILALFFAIRGFIVKKKAHIKISSQKHEIEKKNIVLEQYNHEINQSIDYAKRLQESILPSMFDFGDAISGCFVFFRPKDRVSGDFYWWSLIDNRIVITAADSTGHGVPGAFMSMLGISFLKEIVEKSKITNSGKILNQLRENVIKALNQKGVSGEQKDGMDMALVSINIETKVMQFSGANNPLYVIRDGELIEFKGNKMPISIYERMDDFTNIEFQLKKNDLIYMFSDGFADQFGGELGKKFKYKPFKKLLIENSERDIDAQKTQLESAFNNWIKGYEQIDDVVVLGIKI